MTQEPVTRQEYLYNLAEFCRGLHETLLATGLTPDQTFEVFHSAVSAECLGCGILVSGEELFALAHPPSPERSTAKIGRLRLGDCARQGCQAYYYRLSFLAQEHDWQALLAQVDARRQPAANSRRGPGFWKMARVLPNPALLVRVGVALAVIVVLLLVRQWHQGGGIPFVREPENFRVDPAPEEGSVQ
jgi:hypothetical protein